MTDESIDRRRFLALAGAATATTLAGCEEDVRHHEFSADAVGLSKTGFVDIGYPDVSTTTDTRTFSRDLGDFGVIVELTSHVYTYGTDAGVDRPFGVLSTPRAAVAGAARNPLATEPLSDLVAGERGRDLLEGLGVGSGSLTWTTGPSSSGSTTAGTAFGSSADAETFLGRVSDGSTTHEVAVNVARTTNGDDAVIAAVVQHYPQSQGVQGQVFGVGDPGRGEEVLELALHRLQTSPATNASTPIDVTLSNPRLVQHVSDTHLVKPGTPVEEPDPPLVEQRYAAPLFDLSVPNRGFPPLFVDVGVDVAGNPGEMRFRMEQSDVQDIGQGAETEAVLHDAARDGDPDTDLPVFQIFQTNDAVTMRAQAPSGYDFDSTTVDAGSDYSVESTRNLRVGFITVHDPGDGSNYGGSNGQPSSFRRSVDACVEYLKRAYPGGLYAYRHDDAITGHRQFLGADGDYRKARRALERAAQGNVFGGGGSFPGAGELFVHGGTRTDAEVKIQNNGFDVWVLLVPDDYYGHFYDDPPIGLFPGSHNQAVSAYEAAVIGNRTCSGTTAQEIGHFFSPAPYDEKRNWPSHVSDHPFAQRDDDGADTYFNGRFGRDHDHARHRNSQLDGTTGNVDNQGLVSTGYDLTDGQFTVVNDFTMSGGSFSAGSVDGSGGNRAVEQLPSFMSYAGDPTWADSRIVRELIDASFGGQTWSSSQPIFEAEGRVDEEGRVVYDEVYATMGKLYVGDDAEGREAGAAGDTSERSQPVGHGGDLSQEAADGEPAEVAVLDPDGEPIERRTVPTTVTVEHHVHEQVPRVETLVPFPEAAAAVRTRRGERETLVNPITRTLRDAVGRLPEAAFADERAAVEADLGRALNEVAALMDAGEYLAARDLLLEDGLPLLGEGLRPEVETDPATRDRESTLGLVEHLGERLAVLAEY